MSSELKLAPMMLEQSLLLTLMVLSLNLRSQARSVVYLFIAFKNGYLFENLFITFIII